MKGNTPVKPGDGASPARELERGVYIPRHRSAAGHPVYLAIASDHRCVAEIDVPPDGNARAIFDALAALLDAYDPPAPLPTLRLM